MKITTVNQMREAAASLATMPKSARRYWGFRALRRGACEGLGHVLTVFEVYDIVDAYEFAEVSK